MDVYIVLAIMAFMIIGFLLGKWPFGLTTMTCCALLAITKVMTVQEAFSGFANKNVLLVAGMFVVSAAFGRTSIVSNMQKKLTSFKGGKSDLIFVTVLFLVAIVLCQFLNNTATLTIMIMFVATLGNTGEVTTSRILLPIMGVISMWTGKLPIGGGAARAARTNALYEGIVGDSSQLLDCLDPFKVTVIPCIIITIYAILAYRVLPKQDIDESKLGKVKETQAISKRDEVITIFVFVGVMICMFLNSLLGDLMFICPIIGALILAFTKTMSIKDIVNKLTGDSVFMLAGALVMADALGNTGAGELIGKGILSLLGGSPNPIFVMFVFAIITTLLTTFISNSATQNVFIPIAASTAVAANMDPRGLVMIVVFCANCAVMFPTGSPSCAIAFSAGGYDIVKSMKFTLPFCILAIVSIVLSANYFFPVFG